MTPDEVASLADRAWRAYHSLPRQPDGKPPSAVQLERAAGLHRGVLSKTFRGLRRRYEVGQLDKIATALRVSERWLLHGTGAAPRPTGPVPPRPGTPEALIPANEDAPPAELPPALAAYLASHPDEDSRSPEVAALAAAYRDSIMDLVDIETMLRRLRQAHDLAGLPRPLDTRRR